MKWLNPLTWSAAALQIVGVVLLVLGLHFVVAPWYYAGKKQKAIEAAALKANTQRLEREAKNNDKTLKAKDAQIKQLEVIAANGKRIAVANERLQSDLRASAASKTDLGACLQRADSLDTAQRAISEFTGRIVQECDRHISDKVKLTESWPE